ncbi:transglutaminase-like domain-containing protein [Allosphingosinicella indica]|uniref:Transglutaminase-like enzyme, putative cysteine protease n=1 Tax=Allosphingosinicella indica TaxID=941907 RepID=A0A1X7FZD0_9SPHN|nr:transglutaminase family protein [Allosphingosinicella indica]SMF61441.1 Transglutaminase-like enzyme, putative cysteine protease [Allosphingosinicella indica]
MRLKVDASLNYHFPAPADVLLAIEVAQMPDERLVEDKLRVRTKTPLTPVPGQHGIGRRTWTAGEGSFLATYSATVDVKRDPPDIATLKRVPRRDLPARAIDYLWPSRYCEVEKLKPFALDTFGAIEGGGAVAAMAEWTRANLRYEAGSSDGNTTAADTFADKRGICRDFAHVMITFARALDIPARMVSAYAWNLEPQDFHAVVEVYLDGGWYLVDPTGLAPVEGLVRICVGRDATDISFMTIFGEAELVEQSVNVERID